LKKLLPSLGWVFLGLLVVGGMLLSAGRNETSTRPRADSFSPSGAAALFALLSSRGYKVEIDRSPRPKLGPGDVAIAFELETGLPDPSETTRLTDVGKELTASVHRGSVLFDLPLGTDFAAVSAESHLHTYARSGKQSRGITEGSGYEGSVVFPEDEGNPDNGATVLGDNSQNGIWAEKIGSGYKVSYLDGIGLTNRFIDSADNAQVFLETLRAFSAPGSRVVFTEAAFGNIDEPGLMQTIGPWAEAAWFQLLFLFVVIVYTLGRRFGLPEEYRPKQKGTRELLEAITDTFIRAKAGSAALKAASAETDARLRTVLKLPRDAGSGELYRLLPENLIDAMTRVRAASEMEKVHPRDALNLIQKLEAETESYLRVQRPQAARRTKAASKRAIRGW
jgi:hypothetical protein